MQDYNSSEYSLNRESMIFKTIQQKGIDQKSVSDNIQVDSDLMQSSRQKAMSQISSTREIPEQKVMLNNFNKQNYHISVPQTTSINSLKFSNQEQILNKSEKQIPKLNLNQRVRQKNQPFRSHRRNNPDMMEAVREDLNDDEMEYQMDEEEKNPDIEDENFDDFELSHQDVTVKNYIQQQNRPLKNVNRVIGRQHLREQPRKPSQTNQSPGAVAAAIQPPQKKDEYNYI